MGLWDTIVKEQNEMILIFWCTTFELKGSLGKAPGLLKLFFEGYLEHLLHIAESFPPAMVLPRVIHYIHSLVLLFGFAIAQPVEELLDSFFSHFD